MEPLPPIPTPAAQRWREFRIQILPLIVFVLVVAMVALLWRSFVQPGGVIGEVEAVKANITSSQDGLLTDLSVDLLQAVKVGDVLGHVQVSSAESIRAELATLAAELRITGLRASIDERRRVQDLEALHMDYMDQQVELAADQAQVIQASNNFERIRIVYLSKDGVFSPDEYDLAEAAFKTLEAKVRYRTQLIQALESGLEQIKGEGKLDIKGLIDSAIQSHQEELERIYEPVALRSPIDGVVSALFRRKGERVLGGEPLLTISAHHGSRIVGYPRQPIVTLPSTNDTVIITTRHQPRRRGEGHILNIGSQIELVRPGVFSQDNTRVDTGLPILVSLPAGLDLLPGELVDLSIKYAKN